MSSRSSRIIEAQAVVRSLSGDDYPHRVSVWLRGSGLGLGDSGRALLIYSKPSAGREEVFRITTSRNCNNAECFVELDDPSREWFARQMRGRQYIAMHVAVYDLRNDRPITNRQPLSLVSPDGDGDGIESPRWGGADCDDNDARRFPGSVEIADRAGLDEDCNPETFGDLDADGDTHIAAWACNDASDGTRNCGTDCDDTRANVHPNAPEVCDLVDNNCDGEVDEGLMRTYYLDKDHDGFGDPARPVQACPSMTTPEMQTNNFDCNDKDATVNPINGNC